MRKPFIEPSYEDVVRAARKGGRSSASRSALVVDNKLVTPSQIAKRLDRSPCTVAKLAKTLPHPLTWAALEAASDAMRRPER